MKAQLENVIVAGVDGSPSSTAAAMWAADEAEYRGAALRLVQAYEVTVGFVGPGVMIPASMYDDVRHWAEIVLADVRKAVATAHPTLEITTQLRHDLPYAAMREASEGALMTVVGSHGASEISESVLGSVALRVAARAAGPVVIIRTDSETGIAHGAGPIWVGLDGSPNSEDALAFAFEEASLRHRRLVALHSWNDEPTQGFLRNHSPAEDRVEFDQEQRLLAESLAGWSEKYPDVSVWPLLLRGRPAASLLTHYAAASTENKPSLIVVGSRGHGGFMGLLMGSTSQALISHAPCPIAVVRTVPTS